MKDLKITENDKSIDMTAIRTPNMPGMERKSISAFILLLIEKHNILVDEVEQLRAFR